MGKLAWIGVAMALAMLGCSTRHNGKNDYDGGADGSTDAMTNDDGSLPNTPDGGGDAEVADGAVDDDGGVTTDAAQADGGGADASTSSGCDTVVCDAHATCDDTSGTPQCVCNGGFEGDGLTCADVNECATNNGGCDLHATCGNLEGGFVCRCNPGFVADGDACLQLHVYHSCLETLTNIPNAKSGIFDIQPAATTYTVYCDMRQDGGGWMRILQYGSTAYTPSTGAVGNIATSQVTGFAKLADSAINEVGTSGRIYRIQGSRTTKRLFLRNANPFNDTAVGFGLLGPLTATACEATSLDACDGTNTVAGLSDVFDTQAWGLSGDDCNRFEADPNDAVGCSNTMSTTERCFTAGANCTATPNPFVKNVVMWMREDTSLVCEVPFEEGAGNVGYDFSGGAHNFAMAPSGGWTGAGAAGSADSFELDGTRYATAGGFYDLTLADQPFTIAFWVNSSANDGVLAHVSAEADGTGWCTPFVGFTAGGDLTAQVIWGPAPTSFLVATATPPAPGTWYHVAMTWSPTDGVLLYIDGMLAADAAPADGDQEHFLASGAGAGNYISLSLPPGDAATCWSPSVHPVPFQGSIDDFRVYNVALSAQEIAALAN